MTAIANCRTEPTASCLVRNALQQWSQLDELDPLKARLQTELEFEARQWGLSAAAPLRQDDSDPARERMAQLAQEEAFLQALRQREFDRATDLMHGLEPHLDDYVGASAEALLLEQLALDLQDDQLKQIKQHYYDRLLQQGDNERLKRMIEIARHEILGGLPQQGQHSLQQLDVDEFSPTPLFADRDATAMLAQQAHILFQPVTPGRRCTQGPSALTALLPVYLNADYQTAVATIPDPEHRIKTLLALARLHRNSDQCPILIHWLTAQAIQSFFNPEDRATAESLLESIQLARAVRRYLK